VRIVDHVLAPGEVTMTTGSTAQASSLLGNAGRPSQDNHRQPELCLSWTIDPATGKPAARWIANRVEPARSIPLREAA